MKSGTAAYWTSVVGAFALGWLAVRSTTSPRTILQLPGENLREAVGLSYGSEFTRSESSVSRFAGREELEAAIAEISTLGSKTSEEDSRYTKQLYEFASRIPPKQFARVLDLLRKPGSKRHEQIRAELLGYWMEKNASAARTYLTALPARERTKIISPAVDAWARIDSEGLMTWLNNLPSHERQSVRETVRSAVAEVLSQRDPALAVSLLLESPGGEKGGTGEVERRIFSLWGKKDPLAAAKRAVLLPGGSGRLVSLHVIMGEWGKADPEAAEAWLQGIADPDAAREAGTCLARVLKETDSEAAVRLVVEQGITGDKFLLRDVSKGWVERDPGVALAWAQSLPASPARDTTVACMLENAAKIQPQAAAEIFLAEAARGARIGDAAQGIIEGLVLAEDGKALNTFSAHFPEAEWSHLAERATAGLVDSVAPAQLISAGLQLPSGPMREKWLEQSIAWITLRKGWKQARQVLEALPAGSERNTLTGRAVLQEFDREVEAAVALAQTLPDGSKYIMQGAAKWLGSSDGTAARNWIQKTDSLTWAEKEQLLRPVVGTLSPPQPGTSARRVPHTAIPRP